MASIEYDDEEDYDEACLAAVEEVERRALLEKPIPQQTGGFPLASPIFTPGSGWIINIYAMDT